MVNVRPIRVFLVDADSAAWREIENKLQGHNVEIVGRAPSARLAIKGLELSNPDLMLFGTAEGARRDLVGMGILRLEAPNVPVVLLSAIDCPAHVARAILSGARGFVRRDADGTAMVAAMRDALRGQWMWTPHSAGEPATACPKQRNCIKPPLSADEINVLLALKTGESVVSIGQSLKIGTEAVLQHIRSIRRKLDAVESPKSSR